MRFDPADYEAALAEAVARADDGQFIVAAAPTGLRYVEHPFARYFAPLTADVWLVGWRGVYRGRAVGGRMVTDAGHVPIVRVALVTHACEVFDLADLEAATRGVPVPAGAA